jgi:hypothetical protein
MYEKADDEEDGSRDQSALVVADEQVLEHRSQPDLVCNLWMLRHQQSNKYTNLWCHNLLTSCSIIQSSRIYREREGINVGIA